MKVQLSKAQYRFRELLETFSLNHYMDKKRDLAERLGIDMPQLDRFIRGDSDPSGTQLKVMAGFFGCLVDDLYKP